MAPFSLQDQLRQRRPAGRPPGVYVDSAKIFALIDGRGYVAARVAEAAECSETTLSNIRKQRTRRISRELRDRLAAVLEVDADEITLQEAA